MCPLTPLENRLRRAAGAEGYGEGFVDHYLIPLIYPAGLSVNIQVVLGVIGLVVNIGIYCFVYYWLRSRQGGEQE